MTKNPRYSTLIVVVLGLCSWITMVRGYSFQSFIEVGEEMIKDQVCYGDLGCFQKPKVGSEMATVKLLNQLPDEPKKQNIKFSFFSCQDRYNPSVVKWDYRPEDLNGLNFNPKNRTLILVHGYTDSYNQFNWMGDIKDFVLQKKPCNLNVINVDWSGGSKTPNYLQAVSNTRLVGKVISKLIQSMNRKFKLTNDAYTVMGHSLGGQISGFVGKNLQNYPKLRLIIALDPAGPAFSDVPLTDRLNPDDAELVVSIHTNGGKNVVDGFGIIQPVGHYSFYPNGGELQPGCDPVNGVVGILIKGLAEGLSDAVACSHRRAYLLVNYDETKFDDFESMAYNCENYEAYSAGRCGTCRDGSADCRPFGLWFDYWQEQKPPRDWTEPISYYIDTRPSIPYSYFFYQIKVILGDGFTKHDGNILLNITGTYRKDFAEKVKISGPFEPNQEHTFLHKSFKSLGRIEFINVTHTHTSTGKATVLLKSALGQSQDKKLVIKEIQVNYMNGYSESKRQSLSATLKSGDGDIQIGIGEIVKFRTNPKLTKPGNNNNQVNLKNGEDDIQNKNDPGRPGNNTLPNDNNSNERRRTGNNNVSNNNDSNERRRTGNNNVSNNDDSNERRRTGNNNVSNNNDSNERRRTGNNTVPNDNNSNERRRIGNNGNKKRKRRIITSDWYLYL